jgi:DNA repair exonuclease SbcCD nuclease subunit
MKKLSFIHTADLHLDSPFSGLRQVDAEVAALLKDATFQAFDNVVDLALKNKVDFLLVAGDVYDSADRSLRAQLRFADGLKRLADAGIRSFVCHGNHDPLDGWSASLNWPEEVHIFGAKLESVSLALRGANVVRIHGVSYPHSRIDNSFGKGFERQGPEPFQVGLFHCSVGSDPAHETYAPRTLDELVAANLDYWALGHVHTHRVLKKEHPFIAYSGTTQGRHIREPAPRGCLFVRVNANGKVAARFEPVDAARWFFHELYIDDLETEGDLLKALEGICEKMRDAALERPAIGRIILRGRGPLHSVLRRPQVVEDLTERLRETGLESTAPVWIERILVNTSIAIDLNARRESPDFFGEVLRVIEASRLEPEQLHDIITELYQDRRGRRFLETPAANELLEVLDEVERLCSDELVEEESS